MDVIALNFAVCSDIIHFLINIRLRAHVFLMIFIKMLKTTII